MLIVKLEECPDNLISYQFRVQSRLNGLYNNYYCEISYTYLAEGIPKVKWDFRRKKNYFTIYMYLRNNIRFRFTMLAAVCCKKRIWS